jgi:hypothetical protein
MPTEVTVHPTAKIALVAVLIAVTVGSALIGLKRLIRPSQDAESAIVSSAANVSHVSASPDLLLPVIRVAVDPDAHESDWSEALAAVLHGRTEVVTDYGRVDVLTDRFAIEVERMAKWHESIGQASHYSETTKKKPVVALILLPTDNVDKLELIEDTCNSKGIKLVLLQTTKAQQGGGGNPAKPGASP